MRKKNLPKSALGFSMIEALVSMSIAAIILSAFATQMIYSKRISRHNEEQLKAVLYARETIEIAKDLETSDWTKLEDPLCIFPLSCHPEQNGSEWILVSGAENLDNGKYARTLSVHPVYRDTLSFPNQIVEIPGALDPDTKKVSTEVSWTGGFGAKTARLETYVYKSP